MLESTFPFYSSTRVHPPSSLGNGYHLPGQVWHGQNCSVRLSYTSAVGACRWTSFRHRDVSHSRVGLPNQQGVREILQVFARTQGKGLMTIVNVNFGGQSLPSRVLGFHEKISLFTLFNVPALVATCSTIRFDLVK